MNDEFILRQAQFDPKVKVYWYLQGLLTHVFLIIAVIGIFTTPLWLVIGWWVVSKQYDTVSAKLTHTSIHLSKGFINRIEKTIPLEKIQDLGMRSGPLLRMFGLASIHIETAGGTGQGTADMVLAGVVDPEDFRNAVLAQREKVSSSSSSAAPQQTNATLDVLTDIRDSLVRIEKQLSQRDGNSGTS